MTTARIPNRSSRSQAGASLTAWRLAAVAVCGWWLGTGRVLCQDWTSTGAASNYWQAVACSANGSKMVAAVYGGAIYTSADAGATWTSNNVPTDFLVGAACSADGSRIAVLGLGNIYLSTNSGATWGQAKVPMAGGYSLASSADGTRLVSVYNGFSEPVYTSSDSGLTWVTNATPVGHWESVACSADGLRLVAAMWNGPICTGSSTPSPRLRAVPAGDGLRLAWTVPSRGFVLEENLNLRSTDWTEVTNPPAMNHTNLDMELTLPASGTRFFRLIGH